MSGILSLNGTWGLTYAEGSPLTTPHHYTGTSLRGRRLLPARVPAPIHQVLLEAGWIDDPNVGMNSLKARWVEEQFWIYRHTFDAPDEAAEQHAWLHFRKLEFEATLWLNGERVGRHANANRPATFDVTGKIRPGENLLVVQIGTGIHEAADLPGADYHAHQMGMLTKRHWHRKPQYQGGWDWNARLMNVGILGDVCLEWRDTPRLHQVTLFAVPSPDLSRATVTVRATVEGLSDASRGAVLRARIVETRQEAEVPISVGRGETRHELALELERPRLWWPAGQGEQFRYTVDVELECDGEAQKVTRRTGVRRVEIDQSPHPVEGRYFILKVNDRPIFCKGGNWVPADMLYSTVTPERYRALVDLALGANFNMLRVWGGGLFTDHALCEACDEAGVLLWHDFLFACSKYPGDDPAFAAEVRREVTFAVRDLAHHPSLVVWCGNNEIEWGDWKWGYDNAGRTHPHYALFHHDIPLIVKEEDPSTRHWISSPFSPDYAEPNDPTVGDQHPWNVSIGTPGGADWWEYRRYVDRFPNEGGVLGASSPATLRQFLPEEERHLLSPSWDHHDNPFATMDSTPGALGHAYATVELWTGRDPLEMTLEEYAFTSGLLQAEGLQEYIANYRRRMYSSASAIFWMYNDSWPVTNGWTIVDYYLRKKLAYHPVRRAFQPVTVVVGPPGPPILGGACTPSTAVQGGACPPGPPTLGGEDVITIYGVNETPDEWSGQVRYGLFTLAGEKPVDETAAVTLPANASTPLAHFPRARWEALGLKESGAFAVLLGPDGPVAQHRLFLERFGELRFAEPEVSLSLEDGRLTLRSDAFAWGVCLDVEGEAPLADNCFDLLPGIPYVVPWGAALGRPRIAKIGSRDAVGPRCGIMQTR